MFYAYPLTKDLSAHLLNQEIITAEILENSNIVDLSQKVFYLICDLPFTFSYLRDHFLHLIYKDRKVLRQDR